MRRLLFASVMVVGCSSSTPVVPVVVVPEPTPAPMPAVVAEVVRPQPPAEPFRFSADAVAKLLEPTAPPSPTVPGTTAPRRRTSVVDVASLSPPTVGAIPKPSLPKRMTLPAPPRDRVPSDLGVGLPVLQPPVTPTKPVKAFRSPAVPPPTAADVPALATYRPDRVPTTDPTAELSVGRIVNTPLEPIGPPPAVLRPTIPDPFALREQVAPRPVPEAGTVNR